ncbi:MAG: hypothetical protein ACOCUL_03700 [Bacteroidota bacterium]
MDKNNIGNILTECKLPDTCEQKKLEETHISWVLISDHYAYKVKKPVKYNFVDYSTLEKRKYFCEKEVELNKRLAPGMYLGTASITNDGIVTGDEAKDSALDYAVMMKKMDSEKKMDVLLEKNKVSENDILKLAQKIATFHQKSLPIKNTFSSEEFKKDYNDIESIRGLIEEKIGKNWYDKVEECIETSNHYLNLSKMYLNERVIAGFTRDGHGDLTARNIFLYDEDPVIFDCIEFNDDFRKIDVLNDIAFLCVDLDYYGKENLGRLFYQQYLKAFGSEQSEQIDQLLAYYKSYRANIRAKVTLISIQNNGDASQSVEKAIKYLELMYQYMHEYMLT